MSKPVFLALGVALLCALPVIGTFQAADRGQGQTARLSAPDHVQTKALSY